MNYFLSTFLNNSRVFNYTTATLKLFFERNNKNRNSLSNLGNVFRNAKWSDLKTQNIKTSFISQYAYSVIIILLLLLLSVYILNVTGTFKTHSHWTSNILFIDAINNYFYSVGLVCSAIYSSFKSWISAKFNSSTGELFKTQNPEKLKLNMIKFFKRSRRNREVLKKTRKLYAALLNSSYLKSHRNIYSYIDANNGYLYPDSKDIKLNLISDYNEQYDIANIKELRFHDVQYLIGTPSNFNEDPMALSKFAHENNLRIARQERWLMKNTPVSRNTVTNNHLTLESKKLINNNSVQSNTSSLNIWSSNFFGNDNLDFFKNTKLIGDLSKKNYNSQEESIEFFMKRFMFLVNQTSINISKNVQIPQNTTQPTLINLYDINLSRVNLSLNSVRNLAINNNALLNTKVDGDVDYLIQPTEDYIIRHNDIEVFNNDYSWVFQILQHNNNTKVYVLNQNTNLYNIK